MQIRVLIRRYKGGNKETPRELFSSRASGGIQCWPRCVERRERWAAARWPCPPTRHFRSAPGSDSRSIPFAFSHLKNLVTWKENKWGGLGMRRRGWRRRVRARATACSARRLAQVGLPSPRVHFRVRRHGGTGDARRAMPGTPSPSPSSRVPRLETFRISFCDPGGAGCSGGLGRAAVWRVARGLPPSVHNALYPASAAAL